MWTDSFEAVAQKKSLASTLATMVMGVSHLVSFHLAQRNRLVLPGYELMYVWNGFSVLGMAIDNDRTIIIDDGSLHRPEGI